MSDFHIAIPEAVTHVQPFIQAMDDAQRECTEAMKYVAALRERLRQDRDALDAAVAALEQDAEQVEQGLSPHLADAAANLGRVKEVVGLAAQEWEEVLYEEQEALASGDELLPGLAERVKELVAKADAASRGVLESVATVSEQLEQAVTSVEQVISTGLITKIMDPWTAEVEAMVASLREFLQRECPDKIQDSEEKWRHMVEQVHSTMTRAFEGMAMHMQQVAAYAAERWDHLFDKELASTQTQAGRLGETLSTLGVEVENDQGQLEVASQLVAGHQDETASDVLRLEQEFLAQRGHWATFGIEC